MPDGTKIFDTPTSLLIPKQKRDKRIKMIRIIIPPFLLVLLIALSRLIKLSYPLFILYNKSPFCQGFFEFVENPIDKWEIIA
jgi:hypothetical protein